jgi:hypothetical protein
LFQFSTARRTYFQLFSTAIAAHYDQLLDRRSPKS